MIFERTPGEKRAFLHGMKAILDLVERGRDADFIRSIIELSEMTIRPDKIYEKESDVQ